MKHKTLLFLLLAMLASTTLQAYDAKIDGIYYNFSGSEATVTYQNYSNHKYYSDYTGAVVIPEAVTYNGKTYSVTTIGDNAFFDCADLTSIAIPKSIKTIRNAFKNCTGLTSVHITDLPAWCNISFPALTFSYDNYQLLTYPQPLYFAHQLYLNGQEVKDLVIPDGVTSIGKYAFYGCSGFTSVTIPNSVTNIDNTAFSGCI